MKEFLEEIAEDQKWFYFYGRHDYRNLEKLPIKTIGLFVDPITIDSKFDDYGNESITYSGRFLLAHNSDIDEDYQTKYDNYIESMKVELAHITSALACSNYQINSWRVMEAINVDDMNMDGLLVTYNISLID